MKNVDTATKMAWCSMLTTSVLFGLGNHHDVLDRLGVDAVFSRQLAALLADETEDAIMKSYLGISVTPVDKIVERVMALHLGGN